MVDKFTKKKRSEIMSKIKSKGSKIEMKMKEALEAQSIEFEYQPRAFGRPDFLVKPNIVVFCDSSFWHGRNWRRLKKQLSTGYWQEHINRNRVRDKKVNRTLEEQGYVILRFWEEEIEKDVLDCVRRIQQARNEPAQDSQQTINHENT